MFFKKKNDNNIDNNDKNAIDIKNVENNNNNNKKEKRKFKDSINKKYLDLAQELRRQEDCFHLS